MFDPTLMLFDSHIEAIIFFGGFLGYVIALAILAYKDAKTKDEKKTAVAFLSVFGSLSAVSLAIAGFFWWRTW